MTVSIVFMGFFVGTLVGLTGVGGAALLTPLLIVLGINPSIAVGTDLLYNSITKLFGVVSHWKQRTVQFKLVGYLALGSIPSATAAIGVLHLFPAFHQHQEQIIKQALGYVLTLVAISIIARLFFDKKLRPNRWQQKTLEEKRTLMILIGVIFGFIVGLTSIGARLIICDRHVIPVQNENGRSGGNGYRTCLSARNCCRSVKRKLRKRRLPACIESVDRLCAGCASRQLLFAEILTAPAAVCDGGDYFNQRDKINLKKAVCCQIAFSLITSHRT